MTHNDYQKHFLKVLSSTSPEQAADDLRVLADAAWHKGWSPDVEQVALPLRRKAAYLADFFASNQAMPLNQSRLLKSRLKALAAQFPNVAAEGFYVGDVAGKTNRDALAKKWGLTSGVQAKRVPGLLDLQRRSTHHQSSR